MTNIVVSLLSFPLIYLLIAVVLVLIPVRRHYSQEGLDFDTLNRADIADFRVRESYFKVRDGSDIFYRYMPGASRLVVVLLHGSGTEGRYLLPLAQQLSASSSVTTIIPDLRGHGESALAGMGDVGYLGQLEDDLEDMHSALRSEYPDARIVLAGHSSGGGLAVKYGGGSLAQFDAYILLAPYLGYKAPTVRPNSGGWVQVSRRRYVGLSMLNNVGIKAMNGFRVLFFNRPQALADPLQTDSYSYRLNESFSPQSYADDLRANKKPMLVLVGENDEAFYADKFEAVFSKYSPGADLQIVPNLTHLELPGSDRVADLITGWLEKLVTDF